MKHLNYLKRALIPMLIALVAAFPALAQPLSGTYTVGGASPNYPTLNAACSAANNNGVVGPVVFNIRSGTYTGTSAQGVLNTITGANATNTITFQAESGPGTVTLSPAGTGNADNYVFRLNNANWIIIKDLTLNNTGATYGVDVDFMGTASNNVVNNCILTGNTATSTTLYKSRVFAYFSNTSYGTGFSGANNKVLNSSFPAGCSYGVYMYGNTAARPTNFETSGNTMAPFYGTIYAYYINDLKFNNNTITRNTASTGAYYGIYLYDCDSTMQIMNNSQTAGSLASTYYGLYYYYCDGSPLKKQVISGNTISCPANTSTSYPLYWYYNQHTQLLNNNFTSSTSSAVYHYLYYSDFATIKGNTFNSTATSTIYPFYRYGGLASSSAAMNDTVENNNFTALTTGGTITMYDGGYPVNASFKNNNINLTSNASSVTHYYYYPSNYQYANNTVNISAGSTGTAYGLYLYGYGVAANGKFYNNKFNVKSVSGTCYGLMNYYPQNLDIYNNWFTTNTSGTNYTVMNQYGQGNMNFYNNSVVNNSTGTSSYTLYSYTYVSSFPGTFTYRNNVFNKTNTSGTVPTFYLYDATNIQDFDYNNFYTPGTNFVGLAIGGTYATLTAWRAANTQNRNSLSYPPAFVNAANGDLTPDVTNANCWSMHGRGIHIAGNALDINGNNRHTLTSTGVPDLGAAEFTPGSGVIPPTCAVTGTRAAGSTQVYTFGQDTVATIKWDAAAIVPATDPVVRQYSGIAPPGLSALNPTNMYFYTDISSTNADYSSNTYYKDPWIGTIATEAALHLAKKDGANPWVGYAITVSGANTARNFITSPSSGPLNTWGLYTGIDVGDNASADAIVEPNGTFCPGTKALKVRIKNNGNNVINNVKIYWEKNFVLQPVINWTTPIPYNNGTPGSNEVIVTLDPAMVFGTTANIIKVYTSLPNGVVDPIPADDTLGPVSLRAALFGEYTVGGTTPDFPDLATAVNTVRSAGMCGPVQFLMRAGTYTGQVNVQSIPGSSAVNRLTIRDDYHIGTPASAINVNYAGGSGTGNDHAIILNNTSYITIKNITINNTSGGSYGNCIELAGNSFGDSILNCYLNAGNTISSTYLNGVNAYQSNFNNLVVQGNTINASCGMYMYAATANTPGLIIENNTFSSYYMGIYYIYNTAGAKVNNNVITAAGPATGSSPGGIYYWYISNAAPIECYNNKVHNFYYGIYIYYPSGTSTARSQIRNNIVTYDRTSQTIYYGLFIGYPNYTSVMHNTVAVGGATYTYTYAGYIYFSSYNQDSLYNNSFACYNTGYAIYGYFPTGYNHRMDFNNLYSNGTNLIYDGAGTFVNLTTLKASAYATGNNNAWANSINYDPGTLTTLGVPNSSSPNCWALNGRGMQLPYANKDYNGSSRVTNKANGVPDIGAIEFDPAVAPPTSTPTPSVAAPGLTQTFTFGETTVATVKWNTQTALTSPLLVRQYSGAIPPANFPTVSQNKYPYFYTDITPTALASSYDFNLTVNYYDTWLGTIPNEANMKLAHKVPSVPFWVSYNQANSSTNTTANTIYAAGVTSFGAFTGIDDGVIFSANVTPVGSLVLCTGNTTILNATPVSSGSTTYTYQWRRNGVDIAGATASSYVVTMGGDYTVFMTATSVTPVLTTESAPITVTVVSPPMAVVNASGALTYCTGSNLTLNAGSVPGVTYQWKLNGVSIGGATNNTYKVTGAGNYTVEVTNIGCTSTSSATLVNAGPIVVNLGQDISNCEIKNTPYILDAGYPGARYTWSTGDTTQTIQVFKGSGVYSVTVDAGPNCIGTDQVVVNLAPLPHANGISYLRSGNTYTFSPSGPSNVNSYLWLFGDGTSSAYKTVVKTFDGSMTVKLIVTNDCGKDTISMVQWATGVNNVVNEGIQADVYPNPATDKVTLSVKGTTMKDVTVINAIGEVVYRAEIDGSSTEHSLNVGSFASGRYIIRATTTEGIVSKPLNVQR